MNKYRSTRGEIKDVKSAEAIIEGLAEDKGLYVPDVIPTIEAAFDCESKQQALNRIAELMYADIAKKVINAFLDDFTEKEIEAAVGNAYTYGEGAADPGKFSRAEIVPIVNAGGAYFLELYHGRTSAFKDMALSILPYLLTTAVKKEGEDSKICILTATSGDTGKAALAGFSDVPGTEIIVFYPDGGVSEVQRAQMITQEGDNVHVFAIKGNFDDAQTGVKRIFNDNAFAEELRSKGVKLSSANSINIGRLIPQVAYYVYGYGQLINQGAINAGDEINIVVPTGNFGNILAAYYAYLMGVPVKKFICASNENKVLTDFINTGIYDARRDFYLTNSPSMDILISSNLERLLYILAADYDNNAPTGAGGVKAYAPKYSDEAAETVRNLMAKLDEQKYYEVSDKIKSGLSIFYGGYATVDETNKTIGDMYRESNYLMDTHTAVAYKVYRDYVSEIGDDAPALIASTASPYKFAKSVAESIGISGLKSDFEYVNKLSEATGIAIPEGLRDLDKREILHSDIIDIDKMKETVEGI